MPDELVRVRIGDIEKNMGRSLAERSKGVEILDEPVTNGDGTLRGTTRKDGRRMKPKVTVNEKAAKKTASPAAAEVDSD